MPNPAMTAMIDADDVVQARLQALALASDFVLRRYATLVADDRLGTTSPPCDEEVRLIASEFEAYTFRPVGDPAVPSE